MHFRKIPPKSISYTDYKSFENDRFMDSLILALNSRNIDYTKNPDVFFEVCQNELNHDAPRKRKYIRGNNKPFVTKALSKSIMERTHLRNKFLKNPTNENRLAYTRKRNFCVSLVRNEKKEYFANLNEKNITDNKKFWQAVKPFLSEKNKSREKITLVKENDGIISVDVEVVNTLKNLLKI